MTQVWCCILLRFCTAKHLLSCLSVVVVNAPCLGASVSAEVSLCSSCISPRTVILHPNPINAGSTGDNDFSYNQPVFLLSPTCLLRDARWYKLSSWNRFSFSAYFWEYRSWVAQCVVPWSKLSMKWSLLISGWDAYPEFCEFHSEWDVSVSDTRKCKHTNTVVSSSSHWFLNSFLYSQKLSLCLSNEFIFKPVY